MKRKGISWEQVQDRLRMNERSLEQVRPESPEQIAAIYRSRARQLALEEVQRKPVSAGFPALVVWLAKERYAIALQDLAEVLPLERCVPVPGAPPPFRGVINVRGEIRVVVDLKLLLSPSAGEDNDSGFVLMLRRSGREIGLRVDRVEELREIRPEELAPPVEGNYLKGVAPGSLMLLSVDAILADISLKRGVLTS